MPDRTRLVLVPATLVLILAACGGGGATSGATSGPTQGAASTGPSDGAPSDGAPTDAPGESPAASTGGGGGGGGAADACALVTADEAGGVLGISGVTTELTPGDFSYCFYRDSAGDAVIASSYTGRGGAGTFAVWKAGASVLQVDGIGDDAVFDAASATLFVLKGDAILGVTAGISSDSEDQRLDWAKQFGEIAADRM